MTRPDPASVQALLAWSRTLDIKNSDSVALLAHAANRPASWVYAFPEAQLDANALDQARNLIQRRARQEPLAYLLGTRDFWSLQLEVSPAVLIPRIETETLVQAVLDRIVGQDSPRIADLGTGSGAIIIALGKERPDARLVATDQSADALQVAQSNARRHGVTVDWRLGSWYQPLEQEIFDAVVSNPPYIEPGDRHLRQGDLRFEPHSALVAANRGMGAYNTIIPGVCAHLKNGGLLALEHGASQRDAVKAELEAAGLRSIEVLDDEFGNPRVACARNG